LGRRLEPRSTALPGRQPSGPALERHSNIARRSHAVAFRGGCRINPRRARWIRSKGGLRKRPSPPSHAGRRLRSRRAQPLWHQLPRACSGLSETTLCDSLREKRYSPKWPDALFLLVHCGSAALTRRC
jgi:hypothetical protein